MEADSQIEYFVTKYPDSDYAIDLKFKRFNTKSISSQGTNNAKFYISFKWFPAINRLKIIVNEYDKTIFIEEALHRLVEIHYHLGLEKDAKRYANILFITTILVNGLSNLIKF